MYSFKIRLKEMRVKNKLEVLKLALANPRQASDRRPSNPMGTISPDKSNPRSTVIQPVNNNSDIIDVNRANLLDSTMNDMPGQFFNCTPRTINLSKVEFNDDEMKVLDWGLQYCPRQAPSKQDLVELVATVESIDIDNPVVRQVGLEIEKFLRNIVSQGQKRNPELYIINS